ncbi:MAG: hypothetical protein P4L84_35000 [Isosphaeraceae bacterium]|nr:hypothetical protein [Isosphaeraceae bacterium]
MPGLVTRGLGTKLQITITGGGGGATGNYDTGPAVDLLDAIRLYFESIPTLVAAVPGGLYTSGAGAKTSNTYVVVQDTSARLEWKSDVSEVHDTRVRFKVYDADLDVAGTVGDKIHGAFRGQTFTWTGGNSNHFVTVDRKQVKAPGHSKGMRSYEFYFLVEFQTRVKRSLSGG